MPRTSETASATASGGDPAPRADAGAPAAQLDAAGSPPRVGSSAWGRALRSHPVITAVMVACGVAGVILGVLLLPEEWSLLRRIAGGAVSGVGVGLLVVTCRMIG